MFLVHTVAERLTTPSMWGTVGALPSTRNLAGGMATSGAITGWLRDMFGSPDYPQLLAEAEASGPGAHGLLMLPYFAGERTPVMDPDARGVVAGLTLRHSRGDLYRAALEATGLAVRHNVEAMEAAGARIQRVVAVGGGTRGDLWTQIVSDITGLSQVIPSKTIGASFGAAFLAAQLDGPLSIEEWNPAVGIREPDPAVRAEYDELYSLYRELYTSTTATVHALAAREKRSTRPTAEESR
jgi:xylulokinase